MSMRHLESGRKAVYDVTRSSRNRRVSDLAGTPRPPFPANNYQFKGGITMPTAKEFALRLDDRPGTLGKVCRTLADRGVNILAFQSEEHTSELQSRLHLVCRLLLEKKKKKKK